MISWAMEYTIHLMRIINLTMTPDTEVINEAAKVITNGGIVIYPTETCYGIGVDATNMTAVEGLLAYKGQRGSKAISVAVVNLQMAQQYVEVNELAEHLYRQFLPGPVTVVSKSLGKVDQALVSDQNTLGIRIPNYPLVTQLIKVLGKPITATSANTSGKKPPYAVADWQKYTTLPRQRMVDLFLDAGPLPEREPSTVVDTTLNEPTILRQGKLVIPHSAKVFGSDSADMTVKIGGDIMSSYVVKFPDMPIVFALQGELGAGKTQLAKGIAQRLKIKEMVTSPTYTIIR
jgi:L-threonylcarbamoyladenylate synthase